MSATKSTAHTGALRRYENTFIVAPCCTRYGTCCRLLASTELLCCMKGLVTTVMHELVSILLSESQPSQALSNLAQDVKCCNTNFILTYLPRVQTYVIRCNIKIIQKTLSALHVVRQRAHSAVITCVYLYLCISLFASSQWRH